MNPKDLKNKPIILKIVVPVIAVIVLIGVILYYFSLKAIKDFASAHIDHEILGHSEEIYSICDKGLTELLYRAKADDGVSLRIQKALSLDLIDSMARKKNLDVLIYSENRVLLNVGSVDKTLLSSEFVKEGKISSVSIKNERFYVYLFDFQPWKWQILIGKNYREYAGIIDKVKDTYMVVVVTLIIATFFLIWSLTNSIRNPILSIIERLNKGAPPDYKGTKEIEFLSDSIRNMMIALSERVQELEKAGMDIKAAKEFNEVVLNSMNDAIYVAEADTLKITDVNSVFLKAYKTTKEEIIGRHCYEVIQGFSERCPDCKVIDVINKGEPLIYEKTLKSRKGELRHLEVSLSPLKDDKGNITHLVFVSRNITERKHLEEQLRHSQKFESIGILSGGIAHDFNNILTAVIGYANLLQMKIDKESPSYRYVQQILTSSERAAELIKSLLAYSRKQIIKPVQIDLNEPARNIKGLLKRLLEENIELKIALSDEKLMVRADPIQIEQVLMNLATNARDSMPQGGKLLIETKLSILDDDFIKHHGYGKKGKYARISITDTGVGIDKELLGKIFDPFFTTKEVGKGTGLGLSMVYGIVKQHNGFINVESEVGKGATFDIYLPVLESIQDEYEPFPKKEDITPAGNDSVTILLVEDEDFVRDMHSEILSNYGYKVLKASDGMEALQVFEEHNDKIGLVLSDIVMPKKSGWDLLRDIRKIRHDIKVILVSGYSQDLSDKPDMLDNNKTHFLQKPISPDNLILKIKEVLNNQ